MKILYLHQYFNTPSMSGGTRSYEMARRLVAWGHEVHMITTDRSGTPVSSNAEWRETEEAGIHVHWTYVPYSNKMSYGERIKAFFAFAWRAARKAVDIGGDVVFATSTPLTIAIPGVYASKRLRIPMVFEVRDLWPEVPIAIGAIRNPLLKTLARQLERFAYRNSAHIIALSPGMKDGIVRTGYPEKQVTVIPNSCDRELFASKEQDAERLRSKYQWLGNRPLVLYAGTFGAINGVTYLARLAAEMRTIDPEIRFLAIGDGKEFDFVRRTAVELGVLDRNFFLMQQVPKSDVAAWFSCASLGTSLVVDCKAIWNNSANKFFDTLAAGKPVAINHGGWQADIINETGAGIVLDAHDIRKAALDLHSCISDPEWTLNASNAAKRLAEERFDRELLASKLESIVFDIKR